MHDGDWRQGVRLPDADARVGAGHAVREDHATTLLRHRADTEAETELRRASAKYRYDIRGHFYRPPTKLRECFHRRVSFCPRGGEGRGGIPGTRSLPGIGYLWFHVPSRGYGGAGWAEWRLLRRSVRILLECFLVLFLLKSSLKYCEKVLC